MIHDYDFLLDNTTIPITKKARITAGFNIFNSRVWLLQLDSWMVGFLRWISYSLVLEKEKTEVD
ncbi:MAG: hypothetical protein M3015_14080 [Bacteroidota bacterium]|nr:hypothetical protein [Bacteroidota bacterium]